MNERHVMAYCLLGFTWEQHRTTRSAHLLCQAERHRVAQFSFKEWISLSEPRHVTTGREQISERTGQSSMHYSVSLRIQHCRGRPMQFELRYPILRGLYTGLN